jgi:hypothetical protein
MTTTSDPKAPTADSRPTRGPAPAPVGQPRLELLSPEQLRAAYPDPNPSTTASPDLLSRAMSVVRPAEEDDPTNAEPIGKAQDLELPYRVVGKIEAKHPGDDWGSVNGSGVLVGPWHVLTASHVVSGDPPGTEYRFMPAYWDGPRGSTGFGPSSARIIGFVGIHVDEVTGYDYMVCQLNHDLGWGWGWFGAQGSNNDGFYTNNLHGTIGYPGNLDEGERPYANNVQIFDVDDDDHQGKLLNGRSDIAGGWSGGPLLTRNVSGWGSNVVGVASGSNPGGDEPFELEDVSFAGGPEMVRLVQYARDNWYAWKEQAEDMNAAFGYTKPKPGSSVAACSWEPGRVDLFWRSADDHLRHAWYPFNGGWSWEQDLTAAYGLTPLASDPAVCSWGPGRLDVFWKSADGHLRHVWYPHGQDWSWEQDMTASYGLTPAMAAPGVASWAPGRLDLFWVSEDLHLRHVWYPHGDDWSNEEDMTAAFGYSPAAFSAPAVAGWEPGRLDLFWRNPTDNSLRHAWYPHGDDWSWEQNMTAAYGHGPLTHAPAVASWGPGRLDVFWRGKNTHLRHAWYPWGDDWSGVEDMSNIFISLTETSPAVCSWESGRLDLFWIDDGLIKHSWYHHG